MWKKNFFRNEEKIIVQRVAELWKNIFSYKFKDFLNMHENIEDTSKYYWRFLQANIYLNISLYLYSWMGFWSTKSFFFLFVPIWNVIHGFIIYFTTQIDGKNYFYFRKNNFTEKLGQYTIIYSRQTHFVF